jgi:hypothetical protein
VGIRRSGRTNVSGTYTDSLNISRRDNDPESQFQAPNKTKPTCDNPRRHPLVESWPSEMDSEPFALQVKADSFQLSKIQLPNNTMDYHTRQSQPGQQPEAGMTMLSAYHVIQAPTKSSIRCRWKRRDKKAAEAAAAVNHVATAPSTAQHLASPMAAPDPTTSVPSMTGHLASSNM